jgi:DNA-binding SARP family transcriptional activator
VTDERHRPARAALRGLLISKLRPTTVRRQQVPARLEDVVRPRFGCLTLVHAGAGYGKTTALAAGSRAAWVWYNLDATDREPATFAQRLSLALHADPPAADLPATGEVLALEVAQRLQGRAVTLTLDRYEQLGDSVVAGRFLSELLLASPALALRVATRTRPALPLERLRLEGRLVEVGPEDLRLNRGEIADLLARCWGRQPQTVELDFADTVLDGWPAALQLWQSALGDDTDLLGPLQPGQPLHEYLHEEVLGTLPAEVVDQVSADWRWLLGRGSLVKRASNAGRRQVADRLVRDRVAVLPGRRGWRLHPLVAAFASMHTARGTSAVAARAGRQVEPTAQAPAPAQVARRPAGEPREPVASRLAIRTFGGLGVILDGIPVADAVWPAAARRLLELLLSVPGGCTSAPEAAQALWPSNPPRAARNSFNVALHGLRRALEPHLTDGSRSRYVVRDGRMYRLRLERLTCDVEDFTRLARQVGPLDESGARRLAGAIDLQSGDFLAGCDEPFTEKRRAQLRSELLDILEDVARWYASSGRRDLAVPALKRLVALEPGRREAWEQLMELHEAPDAAGQLASTG